MSELLFMKFKPGARSLDWIFKDPDTEITIKAYSRADLIKQVVVYRQNNRLDPIENLDDVLDDYLCRLPQNCGLCRPFPSLNRGFHAFWKGGILLLRSLKYKVFATQEEAETRANQCKDCPFNQFPNKGHFIKWSDMLAEKTVGSKKVTAQNDLGNCMSCTCSLKSKVWYKGAVSLTKEQEEQMQSVNCWQLSLPKE